MATNRDLLKEALADAKAVKEMAIANAKAALEEAFTPQLQSMLSMKLQEMDEEDEEELDESGFGPMINVNGHGNIEDDSSLYETDDADEDDMDLDELLNELNEEEEEMESEEEEMETEEGEPLDLEDMTDEDLKKFIEDVISDMVSSGELEAGHEVEGEEGEEVESEEEEEVNLDELLAEIEGMDEEMEDESMMYEEEEELEEGLMDKIVNAVNRFGASGRIEDLLKIELPKKIAAGKKLAAMGKIDSFTEPTEADIAAMTKEMMKDGGSGMLAVKDKIVKYVSGSDSEGSTQTSTMEAMQSELDEALATIKTLRGDLNEINLLNAKLLFTNKIFKAKNLTESQKVNVLTSFDKATTVKEVKLVFETLNEGLKTKNSKVNENYGSASKGTGTTNAKQPIVESNDMVSRFQKLAGII
jgi:hypothetical protein